MNSLRGLLIIRNVPVQSDELHSGTEGMLLCLDILLCLRELVPGNSKCNGILHNVPFICREFLCTLHYLQAC